MKKVKIIRIIFSSILIFILGLSLLYANDSNNIDLHIQHEMNTKTTTTSAQDRGMEKVDEKNSELDSKTEDSEEENPSNKIENPLSSEDNNLDDDSIDNNLIKENQQPINSKKSTKAITPALASNEVIVNDFVELKNAITNTGNGITTVYLGSNITMQSGGIVIPAAKSNLIIDGTNPNNGQRHTLYEYPSAAASNSFFINTNRTDATVTLRNMDIQGQNYYGTVCVYGVTGVTNIFDNVDYFGPQSVYNPAGKAIYRNSQITIPNQNFTSASQEIGEVSSVSFEGNVILNHQPPTAYTMFSCTRADGEITFEKDSNVIVNTNGNFNNAASNTTITFNEGATLNATQTRSFGHFFNASGGTFNMKSDSNFNLRRTTNSSYSALWMNSTNGFFTMENAKFSVTTEGNSSTNATLRVPTAWIIDSDINMETQGNQATQVISGRNDILFFNSNVNIDVKGATSLGSTSSIIDIGTSAFSSINSKFNINVKDTNYGRLLTSAATSFTKGAEFNYNIEGTISSPSLSSPTIYTTSLNLDNSNINGIYNENSNCGIYVKDTSATALSVKNNSIVDINTPSSSYPIIQSQGGTTFDSGSKLYLKNGNASSTSAYPLYSDGDLFFGSDTQTRIIMESGTAYGGIYIAGSNKKVQFNDVAYFIAFAPSARKVINNASILSFSINAQQVNQWTTYNTWSNSGTLNHLPAKSFIKANDVDDFIISGTIASGTSGVTSITSSNYSTGDSLNPNGNLSFLSSNSRIMSIGRMSLNVNNGIAGLTSITGTTSPLANVKASYKTSGSSSTSNSQALSDGSFSITTSTLDEGDFSVTSNWNYLYLTHKATAIPSGSLRFIYVPTDVPFGSVGIPSKTTTFPRSDASWNIKIKDDRSSSSNWKLTLKLIKPMTPNDISKPTLSDALIYVDSSSASHVLSTTTPTTAHTSLSGTVDTTLTWPINKGLLLKVAPGKVYSGINYSGEVQWILQDIP